MPKSYDGLMSQIRKLQAQANRLGKVRVRAIARVNALIKKFDIGATELVLGKGQGVKRKTKASAKRAKGPNKRAKVAPKYRGPDGATWSGRGMTPVWLRDAIKKGKKKESFLIKKSA